MDPYTRLAHRNVYRNRWVDVEVHDIVHPTGARGEHVLIVTPPAVGVIVVDGDALIFARQPRFGARATFIEIVKGGADEGESPLAAAKRELREELGLEARDWRPLGEVYEIPSIVSNPVALFVASELERVESAMEDVEQIDAVRLLLDQAIASIDDAVTLAALLRYSTGIPARPAPR